MSCKVVITAWWGSYEQLFPRLDPAAGETVARVLAAMTSGAGAEAPCQVLVHFRPGAGAPTPLELEAFAAAVQPRVVVARNGPHPD